MNVIKQKQALVNGFTLLELLVVLLLIGLLVSVVLPRMSNIYDRVLASFELEDIRITLARIPLTAFTKGVRYQLHSLPSAAPQALDISLPKGWSLVAEEPIIYQENGVCLGGRLVASYETVSYTFNLAPPRCVPKEL